MTDQGKENPDEQKKDGGAGPEGTIPASEDGIAAGSGDEASNFEPEEDPDAAGES